MRVSQYCSIYQRFLSNLPMLSFPPRRAHVGLFPDVCRPRCLPRPPHRRCGAQLYRRDDSGRDRLSPVDGRPVVRFSVANSSFILLVHLVHAAHSLPLHQLKCLAPPPCYIHSPPQDHSLLAPGRQHARLHDRARCRCAPEDRVGSAQYQGYCTFLRLGGIAPRLDWRH